MADTGGCSMPLTSSSASSTTSSPLATPSSASPDYLPLPSPGPPASLPALMPSPPTQSSAPSSAQAAQPPPSDSRATSLSSKVFENLMIDGYEKNMMLVLARHVFDEMSERDLVSWNSMIFGCMDVGDVDDVEVLFVVMPERDMVSWTTSPIDLHIKHASVKE